MKLNLTIFFLLLMTSFSWAQSNDECEDAIVLDIPMMCPSGLSFSNVGATASVIATSPTDNKPSCFNGAQPDNDVWFMVTVPSDGSIPNLIIEIEPDDAGPNTPIAQPQIAVYRGECGVDELAELACATSALGESSVSLDLNALDPGTILYLRIEDWTASASANAGDFTICVKEPDPIYNMGEENGSSLCSGILYDSGGPDGDYSNDENNTFVICPSGSFTCINFSIENYQIENGWDDLFVFEGNQATGSPLFSLTGQGSIGSFNVESSCITVQFSSDGSVTNPGFALEWNCSSSDCDNSFSTCSDPDVIPSLPFTSDELTTCGAFNNEDNNPCGFNLLGGEDYIFTYTSPGDECISLNLTGVLTGTTLSVYDNCPSVATNCLGTGSLQSNGDVAIPLSQIVEPSVYYIVVDNPTACTDFTLTVNNVECPDILPASANCGDALSINGCGGSSLPQIISVAQEPSTDSNVFQPGVNDGCWGSEGQALYTWFTFQAQADGNFGFLASNAVNPNASDIDIQVWGPYPEDSLRCDYIANNQPIRSTYDSPNSPNITGLIDVNPNTGEMVTDECETAAGDGFITTIPVTEGEWYTVLINDFSGTIGTGGINMNFGPTTGGVLDEIVNMEITADTVICSGDPAQLMADGGLLYHWLNSEDGLSCEDCPNPVATVSENTTFDVEINAACTTDTLSVTIGMLIADTGVESFNSCLGENISLFGTPDYDILTYEWIGETNALSCVDCPNPVVSTDSLGTGTHVLIFQVTGETCDSRDTIFIEVLPEPAPEFAIIDDVFFCSETDVELGGSATVGVTYNWTMADGSSFSTDANPMVTVSETTTYYLEASNNVCPVSVIDSVTIAIGTLHTPPTIADQVICPGTTYDFSANTEAGVTYSWSPAATVSDPNSLSTTFSPTEPTTYTLTLDDNGCQTTTSFTISLQGTVAPTLVVSNDTTACVGSPLVFAAQGNIPGTVTWFDGSEGNGYTTNVVQNQSVTVTFTPDNNCFESISETIEITALGTPVIPEIEDQVKCGNEPFTFTNLPEQPGVQYNWTPSASVIQNGTLNGSFNPDAQTFYQVIGSVGTCADTATFTLNVAPSPQMMEFASQSICLGDVVTINETEENGVTYSWSPIDGVANPNTLNTTITPTATTTYILTAQLGDCTDTSSLEIVVGDNSPAPLVVSDDVIICEGESVSLSATTSVGGTFSWSNGSTGESINLDNLLETTEITVTFTPASDDCYIESSETINVIVNSLPVLPTLTNQVLCSGDGYQVEGTPESNVSYQWIPATGVVDPTVLNAVFNPTTATTYRLIATNQQTNCSSEISFDIGLGTEPILDLVPTVGVCPNVEFTLEASANTPGVYTWNPGGLMGSSVVVQGGITENTEYTLTFVSDEGCVVGSTVEAQMLEGIMITELTANPTEGYVGDEITLSVTTDVTDNVQYNWSFGGSSMTEVVTLTTTPEEQFSVIVTDENGCFDQSSISINVGESKYGMPNAFTPNKATNSKFGLMMTGANIEVLSLRVWNRFGKLVHEGKGDNHAWDGTNDGKLVPSDAYIYGIEIRLPDGTTTFEKGDVTVIR